MSVRKQFFIATRKFERITLRRKSAQTHFRDFCEECGKETEWLTLHEVSAITGKGADEIKAKIADGEFDFQITDDKQFLLCAESVFKQTN